MVLKKQIKTATIAAMKNKDSNQLALLRLMSSFITNKEIELGIKNKEDLNDGEVMKILRSMIKSRENAILEYQKINDNDSIVSEKNEIAIISTFLPTPYSEAETKKIVEGIFTAVNVTSIRDTAKIMATLNAREDADKFNKTLVAKLIKEKLSS